MIDLNKNQRWSYIKLIKKEWLALSILILLLICYLLPGLLSIEKLFFDDVSVTFVRLVAIAKHVKNGEIPFWDSNGFAGAKPYFALVENPIYNFLFYPLFFIADLDNIDQSFIVLYIIPYCVQVIFASIGIYFFTRKVLKFHILASLISSFLYVISPFFGCAVKSIHDTHIFAFLPWVLLFIFLFIKTNKLKFWLLSILFALLLSLSVTLNYMIRAYFLIGLLVFIYCLFLFFKRKIKFMTIINSLIILIISLSLLSFIWLGMLEGINWVNKEGSFKFSELISDPHFSMFPGNLINIFIQDFHGLISCKHTWGNAVKYDNNILLSGGFFSTFLIFISLFLFLLKRKSISYRKKVFFWLLFSIYIFILIIMMGKFTPLYYIFCTIIPWVFKIPYAYYFLFYQGFIYAILVGFGLNFLFISSYREILNKNILTIIYVIVVIILMITALLEPIYISKTLKLSYITLYELSEIPWFLINKILILAVSIVLLFFIFYNIKRYNFTVFLLIALIIIESFFYGYIAIYKNTMSPRLNEHPEVYRIIFQSHYKKPTDHPFLKDIDDFKTFYADKNDRFIGSLSVIDNMALFTDKKSTFGYDSKPVTLEMYKIINKIASNYPYELKLHTQPINFFRNFNIAYLLSYRFFTKDMFFNKYDWEYVLNNEEVYEPDVDWISNDPIIISTDSAYNSFNLMAYKLLDPLPYFFFHDNVEVKNDNSQFNSFLYSDLREKIFLNKNDYETYKKLKLLYDQSKGLNTKTKKVVFNDDDEEIEIIDEDDNSDGNYNDDSEKEILKSKEYFWRNLGFEDDDNNDGNYNDSEKREIPNTIYIDHFNKLQQENEIFNVLDKNANKLTLFANVKKTSVLIRNETFHKDWKVKITEKDSGKIFDKDILKVNFIQQGVILAPGKYILEYKFFPKVLKTGLIISLIVFIIFIIYFLLLLIIFKYKF